MTGRSVLTAPSRRGAPRLVVLALTLVSFVVLHALWSVAGRGTHCGSAPALLLVPDPHSVGESQLPDHQAIPAAAHTERAQADATTPADDPDDVTTGCLLALFGALALIGLRLLRQSSTDTTHPQLRPASASLHAARAPPGPRFLSLCVFRL